MKFGKEFVSQMVPEWHEAYMDYHFLKTIIKDLHQFKQKNTTSNPPETLMRNMTLYRAFSGLTLRHHHRPCLNHSSLMSPRSPDVENPVIVIHSESSENVETRFLMANEEGGEYELVYFKRLDDEFNKVDKFYRSKVDEVMKEAEVLNRQMDALIAFRVKVESPQGWLHWSAEITRLASDISVSTAALAASTPLEARASSRRVHMDVINEDGSTKRGYTENEPSDQNENDKNDNYNDNDEIIKMEIIHERVQSEEIKKPENGARALVTNRPAPLEILSRVQMNHTLETPRSTIKSVLKVPKNKELKFSRENLRKVENQLKRAFVEFYQKLRLLKSFSFLNMLAFSKIMKKYDKVTSRNASKAYLNMVDNSYIGSSDEVIKLMERVEATFIKHFSNSNRRKGMSILRPKQKREKHFETFSLGFFAGCVIALALALILIIRARHLLEQKGRAKYMETLFPLYSLFAFVVLHMIMYAANIYFWRKYRVNYSFIFGFKQGTELGYREVLLASFGLSVLALSSVILNLDMEMDPKTHDYKSITELLPLGVLLVVVATLFCPFNIIYRSSRYFFLVCLFHCICAPLYKVTLPDFFLADQLTSQVQALRSFEFYICYYGWGDYKLRENSCKQHAVFNTFSFIVAVVPYTWRLFQCLRRLVEEKDAMQGYNGLKYFSTIVAVCMRTAYSLNKVTSWNIIAWISSAIAAIICTYWDLVHDWGLLQKQSKNRWLRDKLLVPHKNVYFGAMVLNVLLRFAWMQTVLNVKVSFLHRETLITIMASLEIIRRGMWNFFRLENEHLNNVGKYRAFKSVPLPFNYHEDDDKDDDKDE